MVLNRFDNVLIRAKTLGNSTLSQDYPVESYGLDGDLIRANTSCHEKSSAFSYTTRMRAQLGNPISSDFLVEVV